MVDPSGVATVVHLFCIITIFSATDRCRVSWWPATSHALRAAVKQFELERGRIPTDAEGLRVLYEKPAGWPAGQPWTPFLESVPHDPWGHELRYRTLPGHPDRFGFYSLGKDGVTSSRGNDADDWNSWNTSHPWVGYYEKLDRKRRNMRTLWCSLISLAAGAVVFLSLRRNAANAESWHAAR